MTEFQTFSEKFADIRILRYQVPGFDQLPLQSKIYAYHLSQAALWGRDIFWDQNYKHNLFVRRNLEYLYRNFQGDRMSDCFMKFEIYLKRIWFANGIHHHYSNEKILPDFDRNCFENIINQSDFHNLNINPFKDKESWLLFFYDTIFNPQIDHKKTNQDDSEDLIKASSINFYDSVTQEETENFYEEMVSKTTTKISLGLNSKLVKENGSVSEKIWKSGGLYGEYIDKIIFHLKEACKFAENKAQEAIIAKLVQFYETGDLEYFDEYNILWVRDTESTIDFINGFIETYDDPLGRKASWESTVQMTDLESDKRVKTISNNAEW
ncbi:MAG: dihydrofolate reductase, partial [Bacteroidales bacterium]|nr:dihydrofolate reductase [Bacteroidales bacterium]